MKFSYTWLNHHFHSHAEKSEKPYSLPPSEEVAELLTFHAYQVDLTEKVGDDHVFNIDVLPNRSHDSFSHKGIARELGRILGKPIYPEKFPDYKATSKREVFIDIQEPTRCPRYMGVVLENVKVDESPAWLKERLAAVGQRSVNNVVDVTNFVMQETGQPLHAFDAEKLAVDQLRNPHIKVRKARVGEKLLTLDDKEVHLPEEALVIADENGPVAIAGIKGGKTAGVTEGTRHIMLEAATFEGTGIRRTSRALSLRTDSSIRFEQGISPSLAEEGMQLAIPLVLQLAGTSDTKVGHIKDAYPRKRNDYVFGVSVSEVNRLLGTKLSEKEIDKVLKQLEFTFEKVEPLKKVLALAPSLEGASYKYGASISYDAPDYFDCSSFISYVFSQAGIGLPRITVDQFVFGELVEKKSLQRGDVIFARNSENGETHDFVRMMDGKTVNQKVRHLESKEFLPGTKVPEGVDHNGIYLGEGKVVHASGKWHKNGVVTEDLDESPAFKEVVGYRRFVGENEPRFVVTAPKERLDLMASRSFLVSGIKEDLIEEIGRMYGYRNIKSAKLPRAGQKPADDGSFVMAQEIREGLVAQGYSEVMTYVFRDYGELELKNPLSDDKKFLRNNLNDGIGKAAQLNVRNAPLLGLSEIKLFEIGTIFTKEKEEIIVSVGTTQLSGEGEQKEYSLKEAYEKFGKEEPERLPSGKEIKYKPISRYPFVLRDIAVFVPEGTGDKTVLGVIEKEAGSLLVQRRLFDVFKKGGKISYAFNLVFQSHETTLSDDEINKIMDNVAAAISKNGWQVR